jgi:hypothetical protein
VLTRRRTRRWPVVIRLHVADAGPRWVSVQQGPHRSRCSFVDPGSHIAVIRRGVRV